MRLLVLDQFQRSPGGAQQGKLLEIPALSGKGNGAVT